MEESNNLDKGGVTSAPRYEESPFLQEAISTVENNRGFKTLVASSPMVLVDPKTGDSSTGAFITRALRTVDQDQFIKIYKSHVSTLFGLSKSGKRLFEYVVGAMRVNDDKILVDLEEARKFCNYKHKSSLYDGIAELLAANIVAMSTRANVWFINPNIVFNGDRMRFVFDYNVKKNGGLSLTNGEKTKMYKELMKPLDPHHKLNKADNGSIPDPKDIHEEYIEEENI